MPFPSLMPAPEPEKNDSKQSGFPGILELTRNVIDSQGYNKASNIGLQGYVEGNERILNKKSFIQILRNID